MSASQMIYDLIRRHGAISRIDLHRKYEIRAATVTRITEALAKNNLICGRGRDAVPRGRSPELIKINDSAFHVIGLHPVRSGIRAGIVSSGGKLERFSVLKTDEIAGKKTFMDSLVKITRELSRAADSAGFKISGIGVALPGEVDLVSGRLVQAAVILPGLENIPCQSHLEKKISLPVVADHDCAMITGAEALWGKASGCRNFGTMFIGQGIGGKFIIDGKLFRGWRNRSGEIGHIPLVRGGTSCACGLKGCFEALASIPAIERSVPGKHSFEEIVQMAENGDKASVSALLSAAEYIGEAAAIIFDILDIDRIVINGDIILAKSIIKDAVVNSIISNTHSKPPSNKEFLQFSEFGQEAGVLGAASAAVRNAMAGFGISI